MTPMTGKTIFHAPPLVRREAAGLPLLLDPESPKWATVEPRRGISCFGRTRRPAYLRSLWLLIGIGAAALSTPVLAIHQGDEPVGRGPFRIRNQFPFGLLFLGHAADDAHGLEPGNFELNVNFTWSNTFVGNDSLRADRPVGMNGGPLTQSEFDAFAAAHPDQAAFFFDGEILRSSFNFYFGINDHLQVGVEAPYLTERGGVLDGSIENFHKNFGLTNAGRDNFPQDAFQYALTAGGEGLFQGDAPAGSGLGDITVRIKSKILKDRGRQPALAIAAAYKFPTGDVEQFRGSGHPDYGVNLLLSKRVSRRGFVYGNAGYVRAGDWALLPGLEISDIYSFLLGYEHFTSSRISWVGHVLVSSSPFRKAAGGDLGGLSYEATAGFKYDLNRWVEIAFSFTENFIEFDNSPDIGPHVGVVCLF